MVIGLSTISYDADGARTLRKLAVPENTNDHGGRRVSRLATLDGGAVVNDGGYSDSDNTYTIKVKEDSTDITAWAKRIVQTYSTIHLAIKDGFFVGVPSRWWCRDGFLYVEILITEKRS